MKGDFAKFGVVLGHKDAFFGIEETLLGLAHFDSGEVAQEVAFAGDIVVLLCGYQILAFQGEEAEVVFVGLP